MPTDEDPIAIVRTRYANWYWDSQRCKVVRKPRRDGEVMEYPLFSHDNTIIGATKIACSKEYREMLALHNSGK